MKPNMKAAMQVQLDFIYIEMLEVNEMDFSITFRTDISVFWEEPRIMPPIDAIGSGYETVLDTSFLDHLWITNLFIYNLKEIQKFKVLTPGKNSIGLISEIISYFHFFSIYLKDFECCLFQVIHRF